MFKNRKSKEISTIIERIKDYYHISLDKENQKKINIFLNLIFQYLEEVDFNEINEYLHLNCKHYIEFAVSYPETINTFFKKKYEFFEEILKKSVDQNINEMIIIIKYGIVLSYLSLNTDITNQFSSNFAIICSQLIKLLSTDNINHLLHKTLLLSTLTLLSKSSNFYNPFIINTCEVILSKIIFLQINSLEVGENDRKIIKEFFPQDTDLNFKIIVDRIIDLTFTSIAEMIKFLKNDINFDSIFENIMGYLSKLNKLIDNKLLESQSKILNKKIENKLNVLILNIYQNNEKSKIKKNNHINFFVTKTKELESLNPEIDPEYDFSLSWGEKKNLLKNKTKNGIMKKVKKTRREAIRNLKKESRLIDIEKQKEHSNLDKRRKEDKKLSNQFIEQTNMEYKKLVTSQTKDKEKKKRAPRKAGNQV